MSQARGSRLDEKVVLVTGAGRGLGRSIAFASAAAGADVILAGRSVDAMEQVAKEIRDDLGRRVVVVKLDVQDERSVIGGMQAADAAFGRIDVLVANSGIAGPTSPLWEISAEDWDRTLAVNLRGTFLCCREVIPMMSRHASGSIVVVGSMTGKRPLENRTPYAASKMALVGFVRTAAVEAGPLGIRVNLVSPGPVKGQRLDDVVAKLATVHETSAEEALAVLSQGLPLGRLVKPEDVAAAVTFLASDEAEGITGEDLNVSAGITMY